MTPEAMRRTGVAVSTLSHVVYDDTGVTVPLPELNVYDLDRHIVACKTAIARLEATLRRAEREQERRETLEDAAWSEGNPIEPGRLR